MTDSLKRENKELRRQLTALLANARHNEDSLRRFHDQELQLLAAVGLLDLLRQLIVGHQQLFGLEAVTLTLIDPDFEVQRLLIELGAGDSFPEVGFTSVDADLTALFGATPLPKVNIFRPEQHGILFHCGPEPRSVAIVPLMRQRRLIGSLNLGSCDEGRFIPGSATDFLERLGAVVAVCLENALNHERLKHLGLTDSLTGVHNRRYFDQRLAEEVMRVQRLGFPLCCLFLDIDRFKSINDNYGHQVGDRVLQEVAARIRSQLRLSDTLGRYGGEEFAVLLLHTDVPQAAMVADRIRSAIADSVFRPSGGPELSVTVSVGLAILNQETAVREMSSAATQLVARADDALYRAKQGGRNRVECNV